MPTIYKNYYQILGVPRTATTQEIQTAFHRLAFKYHPDRNAGARQAEEKFKEINEAHQVLSNPEKRAQFDLQYDVSQPAPGYSQHTGTSQSQSAARPASARQNHPDTFSRHPQKVEAPTNIEVIREASRLRIIRKWSIFLAAQQTLPTLLTIGPSFIPVIWLLGNFIRIVLIDSPSSFLNIIFAFILAAGISYGILANSLNQTSIEIDAVSLSIRHGPLPFLAWPNRKFPVSALKLVFPDRAVIYYGEKTIQSVTIGHKVSAMTTDFKEVALLTGLGGQDEAAFIAQEIAQFLHLQPA